MDYQGQIFRLAERIREADAILIGGGSGLSSAAGYNHYHWTPEMEDALSEFKEYYSFHSPFSGFYYCYSSPEQQWAYYSQYIRLMQEAPTGQPYLDLKEIVGSKPCFILTTNVDMQFGRVFRQEQICAFQGDFGYLQCSQPCHDHIYPNRNMIREMTENLQGIRIPQELVPRCPECGRIMVPWVRDDTFLEGIVWRKSVERYHTFLGEYLIGKIGKKLLLLELGVGEMTPSIIKLPFWDMTLKNDNVFYVSINKENASFPEQLRGKSIYITADLADFMHELRDCI